MRGFFVTGTDTEVGKTTVAASILLAARQQGWRVGCMKPLESGCRRDEAGELVASDALLLLEAAGGWQDLSAVCLHAFEEAVAPGVAAANAGVVVDLDRVIERFRALCELNPELVVIEGAGGWLVPAGNGVMMSDLAVRLGLPVLIVSRPTLGTINHTLLTIESVQRRGLEVAGVVFSQQQPELDRAFVRSNAEQIEQASSIKVLGTLRYQLESEKLGVSASEDLELDLLLG